MASEIKVDTVSEKTSANGVTIDGVNIKDSKIVTANSIDSDVYVDGSIDTAHLAADAITGAKIADDAINSEHYTDGSIDTAHIADGQVTVGKLATAVFTGATDIGAAIVDADLFLMDDGAGGTIRKTTAARIKTYAGGAATIGALTDVSMDITNFVDGLLIQTNTDGSAPGTGTLNGAGGNIGIGKDTFAALTTGDNNVSIGLSTGKALTEGNSNVLIGNSSGDAVTTGGHNVILGTNTGGALTTADGNILIGKDAGGGITTGATNIFIGYEAGDGHDTETDNIGIGKSALGGPVAGGEHNVCIGQSAGDAITSADYNIFIGQDTGTAATTGGGNVAVGYNAGSGINTGINSTLVGISAGAGVTSGGGIIAIGKDSGRTGSPGGNISTASDIVAIGDENIGACHIQTDWTVASDKRDKTDIESIKMGLDFVNKLEPITYRWDKRSKYNKDLNTTPTGEHKENWLDTGFLAQDVEVLEEEYGYKIEDNTNITTNLSEDGKQYGLTYAKFVPILTKAIQELSAEVKELKTKLEAK